MNVDAIALCALIIATLALLLGSLSLVFVVGLKNSTHRIEYVDPYASNHNETEYAFDVPKKQASTFPIHPEQEHLLQNSAAEPVTMTDEELYKYFTKETDDE